MRRVGRAVLALLPAAMAGGFWFLAAMRLADPGAARLPPLVLGAAYGVAVLGLVRLFRVAPFGWVAAGVVCGPVPLALLPLARTSAEERNGLWLLALLLGLAIGLLEWARVSRVRDDDA